MYVYTKCTYIHTHLFILIMYQSDPRVQKWAHISVILHNWLVKNYPGWM